MTKKSTDPTGGPTRMLWRFVDYYNKHIKEHSKEECVGVIRNIQRIIDKGLGVEDLAQALENYEKDEWRKANPRYSKPIRSFFTYEMVKEWLNPRPKLVKPDPLARLSLFEALPTPPPAAIAPLDNDPVDDL